MSHSEEPHFATFPRTEPPAGFIHDVIQVFRQHKADIGTLSLTKGLTSDQVLGRIRDDLEGLGFEVERGKRRTDKIERPVFFGEDGIPTVRYEIDAYHPTWRCGMEVEAGRASMGNAVYRDLILASVMVDVDYFILAVPQAYKYKSGGKSLVSRDYEKSVALADTIYGHSRLRLPYSLTVIGY